MIRALFLLGFIFINSDSFAQNRNNIWFFGYNGCGVNFNTSPPSLSGTINNINAYEACATICNNNGSILFYTNGEEVLNRNHVIMPNGSGLLGSFTSTQTLIVPKPCDTNIYYLFTVPGQDTATPLSYSIIDMRVAGGLGDVVTKNIPLYHPVTESLACTLQSNGVDYWVVAQMYGPNGFLSYSVTAAGVNPVPVISYAGTGVPLTPTNGVGYLRISPDGTKICQSRRRYVDLFDFNKNSGVLSNSFSLGLESGSYNYYGVEFSPDNSKLYLATNSALKIKQYNLLAGSQTDIQNSGVEIVHMNTVSGGALKIGPDNKIYAARFNRNYLGVINEPNLAGAACNYVDEGFWLGFNKLCQLGLPNNLNAFSSCNYCAATNHTNLNVSICENAAYQAPSGAYINAEGIFLDTVRNQSASCDSIIYTINLSVNHPSFLTTDVHICAGETYELPSGIVVTAPGIYIDTLRNNTSCDSIISTIHLTINDNSFTSQIDSILEGQNYTLPSGVITSSAGTYQSVLVNSQGCDSIITTLLKVKEGISGCLLLNNAFTPNGDGINDYWVLYKYNCFKKVYLRVYNRYGSLVYQADDYKNDWNGLYKTKTLPDGTYYYILKVISFDNKEYVFKDNVTILR